LHQRVAAARDGSGYGPGLAIAGTPALSLVSYELEQRHVVLTSLAGWSWRGVVPRGARLELGCQLLPDAWQEVKRLDVDLTVKVGGAAEVVASLHGGGRQKIRTWLDTAVDLGRWTGKDVEISLTGRAKGLAADDPRNLIAWGPVALVTELGAVPALSDRPNVLFILVDTLRRDHLGIYGYQRPTSPQIDQLLGAAGTVFEDAYSQAPWTLPSVVSLFTGRYPGEVLGEDLGTYGLPPNQPVLPELLQAQGYVTAGFIGNPTLYPGNGFDRGFDTLYMPEYKIESLQQHAEEVSSRAGAWLTAHQGDRFFAYLHFIDPHDPYENSDLVRGRSDFDPDYRGALTGRHVHGVYNGRIPLGDQAADIRYLTSLYDSEIRYVDRHIGEVLRTLSPEVLKRTLIVLTSDHGEELFDHGGWKHGQTLYEEQIHVPLLVRWDGRVTAGRRVSGTVSLLDLLPTLMAASGAEGTANVHPEWDGISLLPVLTTGVAPPRRTAFAQHLTAGPLRAAAVLDREKLILFNREAAFDPGADQLQAHLWAVDLARLARHELYDLERDPQEHDNLAAKDPARAARLEPVIQGELDQSLPGLRVLTSGLPPGSRLAGTIRFDRPLAGHLPFLLAPGDKLTVHGTDLVFDLAGETLAKGALVLGDWSALTLVDLRRDGVAVARGSVSGPAGPLVVGAVVERAAVGGARPTANGGLSIWEPAAQAKLVGPRSDETMARLRALGYVN
jgi:arylsulfatase A-like enzyme